MGWRDRPQDIVPRAGRDRREIPVTRLRLVSIEGDAPVQPGRMPFFNADRIRRWASFALVVLFLFGVHLILKLNQQLDDYRTLIAHQPDKPGAMRDVKTAAAADRLYGLKQVHDDAEYNALLPGTVFQAPDGTIRRKH